MVNYVEKMESDEYGNGPEKIAAIAEDALKIFRLNIFIIAVYSSIVGLSLQNGSDNVSSIVNSHYTLFGMILWMGTTTTSILTYRVARKYSTAEAQENTEEILRRYSPKVIVRNSVANSIGVLLTVFAFFFGYLDGVGNGNLPVWVPSLAVALGMGAAGAIFTWLVIMNWAATASRKGVSKGKEVMRKITDTVWDTHQNVAVENEDS